MRVVSLLLCLISACLLAVLSLHVMSIWFPCTRRSKIAYSLPIGLFAGTQKASIASDGDQLGLTWTVRGRTVNNISESLTFIETHAEPILMNATRS